MKKILVIACMFISMGAFAQLSKQEVSDYIKAVDLTGEAELTIWNTYGWNSQDGLYHTYSEWNLAKLTLNCGETGLTLISANGSRTLISYSQITHIDYFVDGSGKKYLHITLVN